MAAPTPNAATTERPTVSAPQVARLRPPLYGRLQHKQGKGARRSAEETVLLGGNRGKKRAARANLHHAKAASDVLSCRFATEDLDVAFLQEPWILSGKIKGLNTKNGRLIYASEQQRPRAALLLNKKVTFVPLSQFTTEDLVAVWAKMPTACGEQEAVIASAYFPGDSNDAPPREVGALVEYCQRENLRWIIGCDANAHHTVWGSTNISNRAIAWWTKVTQRKANADLSKLQRLVCVGMTGAMSTCPTDALGIITAPKARISAQELRQVEIDKAGFTTKPFPQIVDESMCPTSLTHPTWLSISHTLFPCWLGNLAVSTRTITEFLLMNSCPLRCQQIDRHHSRNQQSRIIRD
ncbi:hypothetical protein ACLKA7_001380 [Drosophila subpalustris]